MKQSPEAVARFIEAFQRGEPVMVKRPATVAYLAELKRTNDPFLAKKAGTTKARQVAVAVMATPEGAELTNELRGPSVQWPIVLDRIYTKAEAKEAAEGILYIRVLAYQVMIPNAMANLAFDGNKAKYKARMESIQRLITANEKDAHYRATGEEVGLLEKGKILLGEAYNTLDHVVGAIGSTMRGAASAAKSIFTSPWLTILIVGAGAYYLATRRK